MLLRGIIPPHHNGHHMTIKERDAFTGRWLLALKTAQADGDRSTVRVIIDALAKAHGIPANYPPR
jgi:hypothetical protein